MELISQANLPVTLCLIGLVANIIFVILVSYKTKGSEYRSVIVVLYFLTTFLPLLIISVFTLYKLTLGTISIPPLVYLQRSIITQFMYVASLTLTG